MVIATIKNELTEKCSMPMVFENEKHAARVMTSALIERKEPLDERKLYICGEYEPKTGKIVGYEEPKEIDMDDKPLTVDDMLNETKENE